MMASVVGQSSIPVEKYVFRYQYVLVEIGANVLREIFEVKVGRDFVNYLATNTTASNTLNKLMTGKNRKITNDQEKLLPPVEKNPSSASYDITLLCLLLRNVCGLCPAGDPVWKSPSSTDHRVEADITRLRNCRNEMQHRGTVSISQTEFTAKWNELCQILLRLNNVASIPHLQLDINNAEHIALDAKLEEQLNKAMKEWADSDRLLEQKIEEVKQDLVGVERKLDHVANTKVKPVELSAIEKKLVDIYRHDCSTLQVSPMFEDQDEELLEIYQQPSMRCVPYHSEEKQQKHKEVSSYKDLFCKEGKPCRNIYISGDAGTGKTSFCKRMCLVWCMAKCDGKLENVSKSLGSKFTSKLRKVRDLFSRKSQSPLQKDIDCMKKFDFLFYVSLRDTSHYNVIKMIEEQLLYDYKETYMLDVDNILTNYNCVLLLDALDEWSPDIAGRKTCELLPQSNHSAKCVHITTCRPYKIENVRLSRKDIDSHVQISGIDGESSQAYVNDVINYMNQENSADRKLQEFMTEIEACGLEDQLRIPMLSSHLVILWFESRLCGLSRATVYANSLEMLFKRVEKRNISFPSSPSAELHLPECLSNLKYCNTYLSLLYKVCLLSYTSLFKQDDNVSSLVFTSDQLQAEPFHLSEDEQQFLCKIGVLSKNKVIGCSSRQKLKLSFIHKSYLEFFAALFTVLNGDIMKWSSLHDFLQFENYILLLAGFSPQNTEVLFGNIYTLMSDDLSLCRTNAIFHYDSDSYKNQIKSLQTLVIKCFKELRRSNVTSVSLKLEDFIFDDNSDVDILRQLLLLNTTCVKSVYSVEGKYYDAFDEITNLHCLHVGKVLSGDYVKFTKCMLSNQSTLHTVCIKGGYPPPLLPVLPVRDLHQLTSLSLSRVIIQHDNLCDLVNFLSDNVHFEHIQLSGVYCDKHQYRDSDDGSDVDSDDDCTLTLNLHNHTQLTVLELFGVNILCKNVNNSSLKSVTLYSYSKRIVGGYIDIFNCIKSSQLEHLDINGCYRLDDETMRTLTAAVKTLPCMKSLILYHVDLVGGGLELNPCVTPVKIKLHDVTMSRQCFHCFIESCVNTKSVIKVELGFCNITTVDGESHRELLFMELVKAEKESVKYMSEYLTQIQAVTITDKNDYINRLNFETTSCQ